MAQRSKQLVISLSKDLWSDQDPLIGSVALNLIVNAVFPDLPFLVRIWIVFPVGLVADLAVPRITSAPSESRIVDLRDVAFGTTILFNTPATITLAILTLVSSSPQAQ
ncbi:MAG: hypothetical protein AAGL10_05515 [Pseudomonadota bacterium]